VTYGGPLIEKIAKLMLFLYFALAWGQGNIEQAQWDEGVYKEFPFSYQSTLSKAEINEILMSMESPFNHQVLTIFGISKDQITVRTCTHGIRKAFLCNGGKDFVFQKYKTGWIEVQEKRSLWLQ
jgi:hypothetical protein